MTRDDVAFAIICNVLYLLWWAENAWWKFKHPGEQG
jgi:hypothetical protein